MDYSVTHQHAGHLNKAVVRGVDMIEESGSFVIFRNSSGDAVYMIHTNRCAMIQALEASE